MRLVRCVIALGLVAGVIGSLAVANAATPNTLGKTTVQQRIVPNGSGNFVTLRLGAGEPYVVHQDLATAGSKRAQKRRSLAYFGQLSDFQLADGEAPSRGESPGTPAHPPASHPPVEKSRWGVESPDPPTGTPLPSDAPGRRGGPLGPQIDDAAIRQLDAFAAPSPTTQGDGARRKMDFALDTGD